jgi:hypothetical protein
VIVNHLQRREGGESKEAETRRAKGDAREDQEESAHQTSERWQRWTREPGESVREPEATARDAAIDEW